ncbi:MAG: hypothetical protein HWE11_00390, partial [Gammaproteobacteria bacterium]|nr:hypothetical protein [Gammaproteobacteria bacterium]
MESMKPYFDLIAEWLPNPWAQASLWITAGILLSLVSTYLLKRLHFWGSSKTKNSLDDLIVDNIRSPVRWSIIFIAIYFAFQSLQIEPMWLNILVSIEVTFVIFLWGIFVYRIV